MTVLSLIGGALGGLMRLLPEVFKLFTLKRDQDHEYKMSELQLKIDAARASMEIDKVHANQTLAAIQGEMTAYIEALKGQGKMSGIKWIDGLNQSVRPILTYWWMILFTVHKLYTIAMAKGLDDMLAKVWTENDAGILSMILGFWFVDRAIKYMR